MRTCPLQITGLECAFHVTDTCDWFCAVSRAPDCC